MMRRPILMGHVCTKGAGHIQWRGGDDYGSCGSHYGADIYLIVNSRDDDDPDWEAISLQPGESENYRMKLMDENETLRAALDDALKQLRGSWKTDE